MSAKGIDVKVRTWTPAVPCKIPDNIISSKYATMKVFVPSYERERRPCIEQLLTHEYQRIWWQEKETWDKMFTPKISSKKLLQRAMVRRKPPAPPTYNKYPVKNKKVKKKKKEEKNTKQVIENEETENITDNKAIKCEEEVPVSQ